MRKVFIALVLVLLFVVCISPTDASAATGDVDFNKVYASLISEWHSALNEFKRIGYSEKSRLSFEFYNGSSNSDTAKAYYALYDIDGNGTMELILRKETVDEDIIAYIFSIKNGKPVNIFGNDSYGNLQEVPWSREGSSSILRNGLIDSMEGDYSIYKIADDGCTATKFAYSQPYDYSDEASLAEAKWRYFINGKQVNRNIYLRNLKDNGYDTDGNNTLARINWVQTGNGAQSNSNTDNKPVSRLSDAEYKRMMKECPEYAAAEKHLNDTWKVLQQVSDPKNMHKYRNEQVFWINNTRQEKVAEMLVKRRMNKDLAFAAVTEERALWLDELVSQEQGSEYTIGTVTGDGVRMRSEPNSNATVITQLKKGTRVRVSISQKTPREQYPWYKVTHEGKTGWVYGEFLKVDM